MLFHSRIIHLLGNKSNNHHHISKTRNKPENNEKFVKRKINTEFPFLLKIQVSLNNAVQTLLDSLTNLMILECGHLVTKSNSS